VLRFNAAHHSERTSCKTRVLSGLAVGCADSVQALL